MSLYAQYVRERTYDEILETEQGFATYRYLDNGKSVYIIDIYVIPECRKSKVASGFADEVVAIAKLKGCTQLLGTVNPSAKGSTESIKVLLGYGMSVQSSQPDIIVFQKEI